MGNDPRCEWWIPFDHSGWREQARSVSPDMGIEVFVTVVFTYWGEVGMGSWFGEGSFKQRLCDHIIEECEAEGYDLFRGAEEAMEVVSHITSIAFRRDKALNEMYEQAKRDAKKELMDKING